MAVSKAWHEMFKLSDSQSSNAVYISKPPPNPKLKQTELVSTTSTTTTTTNEFNTALSSSLLTNLKQLHGMDATWNSQEQGLASYYVALNQRDTIIVLPTGGGKSEIILTATLLPGERLKTTVFLVPTTALKLNIIKRQVAYVFKFTNTRQIQR